LGCGGNVIQAGVSPLHILFARMGQMAVAAGCVAACTAAAAPVLVCPQRAAESAAGFAHGYALTRTATSNTCPPPAKIPAHAVLVTVCGVTDDPRAVVASLWPDAWSMVVGFPAQVELPAAGFVYIVGWPVGHFAPVTYLAGVLNPAQQAAVDAAVAGWFCTVQGPVALPPPGPMYAAAVLHALGTVVRPWPAGTVESVRQWEMMSWAGGPAEVTAWAGSALPGWAVQGTWARAAHSAAMDPRGACAVVATVAPGSAALRGAVCTPTVGAVIMVGAVCPTPTGQLAAGFVRWGLQVPSAKGLPLQPTVCVVASPTPWTTCQDPVGLFAAVQSTAGPRPEVLHAWADALALPRFVQ
jgi:hypothetical protein